MPNKYYVVDQISDGIAHLESETGESLYLKLDMLPINLKEGHWLEQKEGHYLLAIDKQKEQKDKIASLYKKLAGDKN